MRRGLRLRDLPRLCRRGLAREGRLADADGRGHAGFRLRRAAEFAAVVPDQGFRRPRRPRGLDAGTAGLTRRSDTLARFLPIVQRAPALAFPTTSSSTA